MFFQKKALCGLNETFWGPDLLCVDLQQGAFRNESRFSLQSRKKAFVFSIFSVVMMIFSKWQNCCNDFTSHRQNGRPLWGVWLGCVNL